MSTHYIENASSGSQYYFNNNNTTTSQSQRAFDPSGYSSYPTNISGSRSPNQQVRIDHTYQIPQQYQSVAGFNRNVIQQRYQAPQSPTPQVRASVRVIGNQDQYNLPSSPRPTQVSPQQHHFQFNSRQQPGQPTSLPVVYQTPGAAQFTHHNVDLWTENPSQRQDHHVQAQRVSVRSVSTGSPQQSHSVSPQRHQDHLQQYYSQLTPEQHQQLLRQQQLQRQQEQTSHYEQQHRVTAQQVSPSSTYHQEQHRSTAGFGGEQSRQQVSPNQQGRNRSESERQRQDEQDYFAAQRQMAAQRIQQQQQQQQEEQSHPVGIRNLASKFAGPAPIQQHQSRSKSTTSRQYSSSSYTTNAGPNQTTTRTLTSHSMTYSALPKSREPPVNSVEYYQMQQQVGNPFTNIQQAAAPAHIQHTPTGFGAIRDRFKTGSLSDDFNRPQVVNRQQPQPQPQPQQQQQQPNAGGSTLSSLRNQYMNRARELSLDDLPTQPVQNISRTIVGEDIPQQKQQQQPAPQASQQQQYQQSAPQAPQQQQQQYQQPAPQAPQQQQQQQQPATQAPQEQQQSTPVPQDSQQEQLQTQNESVDQQEPSSEVASSPTNDSTTAGEGVSSF